MGEAKVATKLPRISRPAGLTRADRPAEIAAPEHAHLPNWVRRVHNQAAPVLGDLLAQLDGTDRDQLQGKLNAVVAHISAGKFSHAWHYQTLIEQGYGSFVREREARVAADRDRRRVENVRKKLTLQIRDPQSLLSTETVSKLSRSLSAARDDEAILALEVEVQRAVDAAQSSAQRRREREISKTRDRITKSAPRAKAATTGGAESWQDVLRRWQEDGASEA